MGNLRALRTRIKSIESTRQVTKSMRMVAASKLRRTQAASTASAAFAQSARAVLQSLAACEAAGAQPCLRAHEEEKHCVYVLFVGNRDLCGAYHSALLSYLQQLPFPEGRACSLVVCGRWGREPLAALGLPLLRVFDEVSDTPGLAQAVEIADYLRELYVSGAADRITLVYQRFFSALRQEPSQLQLLPVPLEAERAQEDELIFEPDAASLLETVTALSLRSTVYEVLLQAKTGEHASRMTAMTAATDNTEELIRSLTLQLNHARQAAITTEISEIVGGAAALDKG